MPGGRTRGRPLSRRRHVSSPGGGTTPETTNSPTFDPGNTRVPSLMFHMAAKLKTSKPVIDLTTVVSMRHIPKQCRKDFGNCHNTSGTQTLEKSGFDGISELTAYSVVSQLTGGGDVRSKCGEACTAPRTRASTHPPSTTGPPGRAGPAWAVSLSPRPPISPSPQGCSVSSRSARLCRAQTTRAQLW